MNRRLDFVAASWAVVLTCACSSTSSRQVNVTPITQSASTTTTVPTEQIDGTGTSVLMHSGPNGFVLINGEISSPLLGHGKFHEDGTFTGLEQWKAKATFTAANGDTVHFTSVGGVRTTDAKGVAHSATTETITGGTGRFAGATGAMKTTGDTVARQVNPQIVLQTYTFKFQGHIITK